MVSADGYSQRGFEDSLLAKNAKFLSVAFIDLQIEFFQDIFQFLALEARKAGKVDAVCVKLVLRLLGQQDLQAGGRAKKT